jgi:hypothetical protein
MELFHANQQWATRPADERFASLEEMHAACFGYANHAAEAQVDWHDLRVESEGEELVVVGEEQSATPTHFAFGQLCSRIGAPASYLRTLPAPIAADAVNHGLEQREGGRANLLFHRNSSLVLRAATSDKYARIWNYEITSRLIDLAQRTGLVPARPTFRQTESDAPALYASDHDMFAFLMSPSREVIDPLGKELFRGVITRNSEVGDCSLSVMGFWFREICGNHIIWGAENIAEIRLTHVGEIRQRWSAAQARVRRYLDSDTTFERSRFAEVTRVIGGTKEDVLDTVFGKKVANLTRKTLSDAYEAVVVDEDGSPNTAWGLAQGMTRLSQQTPFADRRTELDRAAGRVLQIKF